MIAFGVFVLMSIVATLPTALSGTCEKIEDHEWTSDESTWLTCYMQTTVIDSTDFLITSDHDESVEGFYAEGNEKLEHLPKNLGETYPNIIALDADQCSIKEISMETFKGLGKLRVFFLQNNQIETIHDDTFEFIPAVERIYLLGNKIKQLNGQAFTSLTKLETLDLEENTCISEDIRTPAKIAEMIPVITEKCGFKH